MRSLRRTAVFAGALALALAPGAGPVAAQTGLPVLDSAGLPLLGGETAPDTVPADAAVGDLVGPVADAVVELTAEVTAEQLARLEALGVDVAALAEAGIRLIGPVSEGPTVPPAPPAVAPEQPPANAPVPDPVSAGPDVPPAPALPVPPAPVAASPSDDGEAELTLPTTPAEHAMVLAVAAREFSVPLGVAVAVVAFLLGQGYVDRRDPKLLDAPRRADDELVRYR